MPAALVLLRWLQRVDFSRVEASHPAEKQALAEVLTALEVSVAEGTEQELEEARSKLLQDAGDWVRE